MELFVILGMLAAMVAVVVGLLIKEHRDEKVRIAKLEADDAAWLSQQKTSEKRYRLRILMRDGHEEATEPYPPEVVRILNLRMRYDTYRVTSKQAAEAAAHELCRGRVYESKRGVIYPAHMIQVVNVVEV